MLTLSCQQFCEPDVLLEPAGNAYECHESCAMAQKTTDWAIQREEVLALKSIYCGPGECTLLSPHTFTQLECSDQSGCRNDVHFFPVSLEFRLAVPIDQKVTSSNKAGQKDLKITVTFQLSESYPEISPHIIVSSEHIQKTCLDALQQNALAYACSLKPEPCLFSILEMLKDNAMEMVANDPSCFVLKSPSSLNTHPQQERSWQTCRDSPATSQESPAGCHTGGKCTTDGSTDPCVCITRIKHMRHEKKYFKILNSWSKELGIRGKVLNAGLNAIYVVLVGSISSVSELLQRWKTQNIDVDSQGKPCKEKMISILCRQLKFDQPSSYRLVDLWKLFVLCVQERICPTLTPHTATRNSLALVQYNLISRPSIFTYCMH